MNKKQKDLLSKIRKDIAERGETEVSLLNELPGVEEVWKEIQEARKKMNEAKRKAAEEAAKPYLRKIEELEEQYSLILKLSS